MKKKGEKKELKIIICAETFKFPLWRIEVQNIMQIFGFFNESQNLKADMNCWKPNEFIRMKKRFEIDPQRKIKLWK